MQSNEQQIREIVREEIKAVLEERAATVQATADDKRLPQLSDEPQLRVIKAD